MFRLTSAQLCASSTCAMVEVQLESMKRPSAQTLVRVCPEGGRSFSYGRQLTVADRPRRRLATTRCELWAVNDVLSCRSGWLFQGFWIDYASKLLDRLCLAILRRQSVLNLTPPEAQFERCGLFPRSVPGHRTRRSYAPNGVPGTTWGQPAKPVRNLSRTIRLRHGLFVPGTCHTQAP